MEPLPEEILDAIFAFLCPFQRLQNGRPSLEPDQRHVMTLIAWDGRTRTSEDALWIDLHFRAARVTVTRVRRPKLCDTYDTRVECTEMLVDARPFEEALAAVTALMWAHTIAPAGRTMHRFCAWRHEWHSQMSPWTLLQSLERTVQLFYGEWTQAQRIAFRDAVVAVPQGTPERWDLVAERVPGRTSHDCYVRGRLLHKLEQK